MAMVRPFYDCRISDLGPDDILYVECGCGHFEELSAAMLATVGLARDEGARPPTAPQVPRVPVATFALSSPNPLAHWEKWP